MTGMLIMIALLAIIPAANSLINLFLLRTPDLPQDMPKVSVLIPARNEENNIGVCVDAVLASINVEIEVIVLDDGSTDLTRKIVEARAAGDSRLRIADAPELPPGWMGKSHACSVLSELARSPFLLFIDADVRIAPDAAARLVPPKGVDLLSGFLRQRMTGALQLAVIPMISSLIYGYLPVAFMRWSSHPMFSVACGQLIMVRAAAYRKAGGHAAIAGFMHDGMQLARLFRQKGLITNLVDGTHLAECKMYDNAETLVDGFAKNATEGMARPIALPVWTFLLVGGHLMSIMATAGVLWMGTYATAPGIYVLIATLSLAVARTLQALKCREPLISVLLHPVGVIITLLIQWRALYLAVRGQQVYWRGRPYVPKL